MVIANVRIDERLIHGQVAAYWTNNLNASRIMVIDDLASTDEIQKMALRMAAPSTVKLSVLGVDRAIQRLTDPTAYANERIFIVIKSSDTLRRIIEKGYKFEEVNVGNISNKFGSQQVRRSVAVTKQDWDNFMYIHEQGVRLVAQMVPTDDKLNFIDLIKDIKF